MEKRRCLWHSKGSSSHRSYPQSVGQWCSIRNSVPTKGGAQKKLSSWGQQNKAGVSLQAWEWLPRKYLVRLEPSFVFPTLLQSKTPGAVIWNYSSIQSSFQTERKISKFLPITYLFCTPSPEHLDSRKHNFGWACLQAKHHPTLGDRNQGTCQPGSVLELFPADSSSVASCSFNSNHFCSCILPSPLLPPVYSCSLGPDILSPVVLTWLPSLSGFSSPSWYSSPWYFLRGGPISLEPTTGKW